MKAFRDGASICITTDYFVDLQSSPAVFVPDDDAAGNTLLYNDQYELDYDVMQGFYEALLDNLQSLDCAKWGRLPNGHYGPCGECDACEISEWMES